MTTDACDLINRACGLQEQGVFDLTDAYTCAHSGATRTWCLCWLVNGYALSVLGSNQTRLDLDSLVSQEVVPHHRLSE